MRLHFLLNLRSGLLILLFSTTFFSAAQNKNREWIIKSQDQNISLRLLNDAEKGIGYTIHYQGSEIMPFSSLGVQRDDENFGKGLTLKSTSKPLIVQEQYEMQQGKRKVCNYHAVEQTFTFTSKSKKEFAVIFRVSKDGVGFRYFFPGKEKGMRKVVEEHSSFHFPSGTKAFLQPHSVAKTGWSKVNPCYEEFYEMGIDAGTPAPTAAGWVYPALFQVNEHWVLITEASLDKNYCGTHLAQHAPDANYKIAFPQAEEFFPGGALNPQSELPWYTPWRVITIGSLQTLVESTLGTDLAKPAIGDNQSFIRPGKSSWSWALLKDDSIVYDVQKRFIDYAADMNWQYCLIDVNWDQKIGYDKIKELADYAKTKNVGLVLWYNSAGDWNTTPYTPKSKLLTHEDRVKEFSRLKDMGIKGVKIDFFGGDGQSFVNYYIDILEDAAAYSLLVNFHGSTIPRGWHRTYPNLMSMEAIKGFEYVTFEQKNADEEPSHCTVLPFTRNAFDPMDYTPGSFYTIPRIDRKTTSGFQLALTVLFLSGIQHIVETPAGMQHVPGYVKNFLRSLPDHWDDTKFISGYPGKDVVLARKHQNTWYVAAINGESTGKRLKLDVSFLKKAANGFLITDGDNDLRFHRIPLENIMNTIEVNLQPYGGLVVVLQE